MTFIVFVVLVVGFVYLMRLRDNTARRHEDTGPSAPLPSQRIVKRMKDYL